MSGADMLARERKGAVMDVERFDIGNADHAAMLPGGTTLLAYRGSIAHGTHVPKAEPNSIDDIDLIGVVVAPLNCYLGLSEWGSRGTKEIKNGRWDIVFYEIRKAASLLLQGNPNILSMLWTLPDQVITNSIPLIENRNLFVGKHVYNAFAGYAHAQIERMTSRDPGELREYIGITNELKRRGNHPNHKGEVIAAPAGHPIHFAAWEDETLRRHLATYQKKGENICYMGDKRKELVIERGYDSKNAAHCIRLLRMCKEFLGTGSMNVYRWHDRQELIDIKNGRWALADVRALSAELFAEARVAHDVSALPPEPNRAAVEGLVMDIVREFHGFSHGTNPVHHKTEAAK